MTNTPNRRRRERAASERAASIVDELRRLPSGLEHRLAVVDLAGAYERLRELLAGGSEQVEAFRGLVRRHEAPSAATVSAILEASRLPRPPELPAEVHYGPGTHPNPLPLSAVADDPRRRDALAHLEALIAAYREPHYSPHVVIDPYRRSTP